MESRPIPAFVNPRAGGAAAALEAIRADERFALREISPAELKGALEHDLKAKPTAIVVAGGDGTISTAASVVMGTSTALCVVRAGTLNHFARHIGVPADPRTALELAFTGENSLVDVGLVNDRSFLNTCVIGAYVHFVNRRDRFKPRLGYVASSVIAGFQTIADFRNQCLKVTFEETGRPYTSAVLFVGVGERDFRIPVMGEPKVTGQRGLHVVVADPMSRAQLTVMMVRAAVRGIRPWPSDDYVKNFIVDDFRVEMPRSNERIALDGEIVDISKQLSFRRMASALAVRVPAYDDGERADRGRPGARSA